MKVNLDLSIFLAPGGAFGRVSGAIDFPVVPVVGDTISFFSPKKGSVGGIPEHSGFSGLLTVSNRIIGADKLEGISLSLTEISANDRESAARIAHYLSVGFGLFLEEY